MRDIVKGDWVKCINTQRLFNLTIGKSYMVLNNISDNMELWDFNISGYAPSIRISDDNGRVDSYLCTRFVLDIEKIREDIIMKILDES